MMDEPMTDGQRNDLVAYWFERADEAIGEATY